MLNLSEKVKKATLCMTRQCWEQGMLAQALLETEDYKRLFLVVEDMVLRQSADGRLCNVENTPAVVDSAFCIEATLFAGKTLGNDKFTAAAEKNIEYLRKDAPRSTDGVLYHIQGTQDVWADSAAFMPGVLAMGGFPQEGVAKMRAILDRLFDKNTGLYFHMWDDSTGQYKKKVLWGVGNGWILIGLLRLYLHIPEELSDEKNWARVEFKRLLDLIIRYRTPANLFHDYLDDSTTFLETECAEMFAYAMYRGVVEGLIDKSYLTIADDIRLAVIAKVSDDGFVMDCASSPDFIRPGISVEGQAHFLMMEHLAKQFDHS